VAKLTPSVVQQAALDWLGGLGCEVLSGQAIAPGEPAASNCPGFIESWMCEKCKVHERWN
jgi:hypothetical protein